MKSNRLVFFIGCVFLMLVSGIAYAELVEPTPEEWGQVIVQLSSGALSALAIVAAVVQMVMLLLRSKLGEKTGRVRLLLVSLMSVVGGVVSLKVKGMEWASALVHSSVLAAVQVFLFDLYKYLKPEKQEQPKPVPVAAKRRAKK